MYLTIKFPTALITVLGENLRASVEAVITKVCPYAVHSSHVVYLENHG
jgi:hypothetical protein